MKTIKRIMIWFLGVVVLIILTANIVGYIISAPKYKGPVSEHFDGKVFLNPGNVKVSGFGDVLKWGLNRDKGPWPEVQDTTYGSPPPSDFPEGVRITFVNHSTFLIQTDSLNILTDPVWSDRVSPVQWAGPKRHRSPGIRYEDLPRIDLVLISHNHYDHLDVPTMKRLYHDHHPKVITPLGVKAYMDELKISGAMDMDWWDEQEVSDNLSVQAVPAQHFSGRGISDRNATLWCGYVIKSKEGNIYFAGDTGYGNFFKEIGEKSGPFKIALIPIGAYRPQWFMSPIHVSPEEAVKIHQDVRAKNSIAMHFGTFPLADDGLSEPVEDLVKALKEQDIDPQAFTALKEGESIVFE